MNTATLLWRTHIRHHKKTWQCSRINWNWSSPFVIRSGQWTIQNGCSMVCSVWCVVLRPKAALNRFPILMDSFSHLWRWHGLPPWISAAGSYRSKQWCADYRQRYISRIASLNAGVWTAMRPILKTALLWSPSRWIPKKKPQSVKSSFKRSSTVRKSSQSSLRRVTMTLVYNF